MRLKLFAMLLSRCAALKAYPSLSYVVVLTGDITTMPGLPKVSSTQLINIYAHEKISVLFQAHYGRILIKSK